MTGYADTAAPAHALSAQRRAAAAFDVGGEILDVSPLGRGLINDTFLVTTDSALRPYTVLQRINRRAFPQPERLMQNLRVFTRNIVRDAASAPARLRTPDIVGTREGEDFYIDDNGDFWRALTHIENTATHHAVRDTRQAEEVGAALGRFHVLASALDAAQLQVTRPNFHQTPVYFEHFAKASAQHKTVRTAEGKLDEAVAFAEARHGIVDLLENSRHNGSIPVRVIHGDPKIDNFLFDPHGDRVVGVIDLDTLQPGLVHYDVGDCIRSCANPAGESPPDEAQAHFDIDICRAILKRYLEETRHLLTAAEISQLYDAILLIPFELGLRFLTDHLEGDVYFKTEWRGHNLHRARVQFRLVSDIEKNERRIRSLIGSLIAG